MIPSGRADPIFAGFDPLDAFVSQLRTVTRANLVVGPSRLQEQVTSAESALNAVNIGRITAGRVSIDFGIPPWVEQSLRAFFELAALVGSGAELLKAAGKLARDLSNAYAESIAAIPIVGILVDIALAIGRLVALAVEAGDKEPPPGEPLVYSRDADERYVETALAQMETGDWTPLFSPVRTDMGWEHEVIEWTPGLTGKGRRFAPVGYDSSQTFGIVPGIAEVLSVYQYPLEMPPGLMGGGAVVQGMFGSQSGGRGSPLTPLLTAGQLAPSLTQLGVTAWQAAMRPSRSTFLVQASKLRDRWLEYFGSLASYRKTLDAGQLSKQSLRAVMASPVSWDFGAKKVRISKKTSALGLDLRKLTGRDGPYGYFDVVAALVAQLEQRQRYALRTLVVAYVPPDAPALEADSALADLHDKRRRQLLDDPARYEVELDLVPDADYRSAMAAATMKVGGLAAGPTGPTRTAPKGKAAPLDPDGDPEPPSDQGNPFAGSSGGSGGAIVAALAAAGLAYAFLRR